MSDGNSKSGQRRSLLGMLAMGLGSVWACCALLEKNFGVDMMKEVVMQPWLGKTVFGPETGVGGDLIALSFCYVPLMIMTIFLRDAGFGKSVLALKTPYNVVMTAFSAWCFIVMVMWRFSPDFAGQGADACENAMTATNAAGGFRTVSALFFWSKYVEWLDSVFLLYSDKPISVLHGYHHLGAPIAMGMCVAAGAEFVWIFVMWNSLIHTVMYFYYTCSGLGIKLSFIRPWITSMQIAQFISGMTFLWASYSAWVLPPGKCYTPARAFAFTWQYVYVGLVLCLFSHFFYEQYAKPKAPRGAKKAAAAKKD